MVSQTARVKPKHAPRMPNPSSLLLISPPIPPLQFTSHVLTPPLLGWLCPKGQVTRAQEAEENYLVKRELATVKQQSEEASAQLEQAQKTIRQLQQPQAVRGQQCPHLADRRPPQAKQIPQDRTLGQDARPTWLAHMMFSAEITRWPSVDTVM